MILKGKEMLPSCFLNGRGFGKFSDGSSLLLSLLKFFL